MSPKQKAIELVNKMLDFTDWHEEDAKECALIAVNEIIDSNPLKFDENENPLTEFWWKLVKDEIEKL
jgi:hypothetical protein